MTNRDPKRSEKRTKAKARAKEDVDNDAESLSPLRPRKKSRVSYDRAAVDASKDLGKAKESEESTPGPPVSSRSREGEGVHLAQSLGLAVDVRADDLGASDSDDEPLAVKLVKGKGKVREFIEDEEDSPFPNRTRKRGRVIESEEEGELEGCPKETPQAQPCSIPPSLPILDIQSSSQISNDWPDLLRSTSPLTPIETEVDNQGTKNLGLKDYRIPGVLWANGIETDLPWLEEDGAPGVNLLEKVSFLPSFLTFSQCRAFQDSDYVRLLAGRAKDAKGCSHVVYLNAENFLDQGIYDETDLSKVVLDHLSRNKTVVIEKYSHVGRRQHSFDAKYLQREFLLGPKNSIVVQGTFL